MVRRTRVLAGLDGAPDKAFAKVTNSCAVGRPDMNESSSMEGVSGRLMSGIGLDSYALIEDPRGLSRLPRSSCFLNTKERAAAV